MAAVIILVCERNCNVWSCLVDGQHGSCLYLAGGIHTPLKVLQSQHLKVEVLLIYGSQKCVFRGVSTVPRVNKHTNNVTKSN